MGWGDEVMVSGQVRMAQQKDPRKVRVFFDHTPKWHEAWDNNPRFATLGEVGNFQSLVARVGTRRPYIERKSSTQWTWRSWGPPRGELYFSKGEKSFAEDKQGLLILEPNIKWHASPNKEWPFAYWQVLVNKLLKAGIQPVQLGPEGATRMLRGVLHVATPSMRLAAAVMARARAAVLQEGGLHHVAAAVGTPAVVIFGGFISPEVTGYKEQVNLFRHEKLYPLGCGYRQRCRHCELAMAAIKPEQVFEELLKIFNNREA